MNGYAPEKHRLARGLRKNERVCSGKIPFSLPNDESERVCSGIIPSSCRSYPFLLSFYGRTDIKKRLFLHF